MTGVLLALWGCQTSDSSDPKDEDSPSESEATGDTSTEVLPGTEVRVPDEQLIGYVSVEWSDREHLLPNGSSLDLSAIFWEEVDFAVATDVIRPAEGLDTCEAYFVDVSGTPSSVPAQAGELTVTLDEEVWFQSTPNIGGSTGYQDVVGYETARPEPAFGSAVGISATGDGAIPAFDFPLVGRMAVGSVGIFSPGQGELVDLDDLTFTWDNVLGGEIQLELSLGYVNFLCDLADDGQWRFPEEYLPLFDGMYVPQGAAKLHRTGQRWLPVGEKYVQVTLRTETGFVFGVNP